MPDNPTSPDGRADTNRPEQRQLAVKVSSEVLDRAMDAFYGAHLHARWKDFVEEALDEYAEKLERERNAGKAFPPRPTEQLPRGRRVGVSPYRT